LERGKKRQERLGEGKEGPFSVSKTRKKKRADSGVGRTRKKHYSKSSLLLGDVIRNPSSGSTITENPGGWGGKDPLSPSCGQDKKGEF